GLRMLLESRMIELDLEIDLESVVRIEARPLVALFDVHALENADEALRRLLFLDAGRLQQKDEWSGAAVHDRHLGRADLDERIVYAQAGECRQQVLDRGDLGRALL